MPRCQMDSETAKSTATNTYVITPGQQRAMLIDSCKAQQQQSWHKPSLETARWTLQSVVSERYPVKRDQCWLVRCFQAAKSTVNVDEDRRSGGDEHGREFFIRRRHVRNEINSMTRLRRAGNTTSNVWRRSCRRSTGSLGSNNDVMWKIKERSSLSPTRTVPRRWNDAPSPAVWSRSSLDLTGDAFFTPEKLRKAISR